MKIKKKDTLLLLFLILISLFLLKDLFKPGFFTSHDGHHQLIRMAVFDQGLKDVQLPVRLSGNALEGYGYPLFVFTYRTPFVMGEILRLVFNLSYMWIVKLVFILSFFLSAVFMLAFLKKIIKSSWAAFAGAVFYIIAPYRFSNIFVRASLGEATAFIFWPLIFMSIYFLSKKNKLNIILGALALFLALMSHAMVFYLFLPFIFTFYLYVFFKGKDKKMFIKNTILQGLLFIFISAYYWLPAFLEKSHTVFDSVFNIYYQDHFPTLKQLIYSPWGYGFSVFRTEGDGMSFQLGIAQWLLLLLSSLFLIKELIFKKAKAFKKNSLFIYIFSGSVLAIFMILPYSKKIWELSGRLLVIDFPWRYLSVALFFISILSAILLSKLKKYLSILLSIFLLLLLFYTNRNHLKINQVLDYPDEQLIKSVDTSNSHNDYMPKYIASTDLREDDLFFQEISGEADYSLKEKKSNLAIVKANVKSDEASTALKMAYFPGWKIELDNKLSHAEHERGKIFLNLPKGKHEVRIVLKDSLARKYALFLSLFGFLGIVFLALDIKIKLPFFNKE